jgi:hypothetical protein
MADTMIPVASSPVPMNDPAERLILHLLRHPTDLIDTCYLMRRFQASSADVQQAFSWLEHHALQSSEEEGQTR